jgi:hypothetical protein
MNFRAAARLTTDARMTAILLLLSLLVLAAIFVSVTGSMIKWDEIRWLPDDYCYLRQAKLFHDRGLLGGLDTHLEAETVRYLAALSKELGLGPLSGSGFANPPCHFFIDATGKLALQYPPGTGFVLWLFPEGVQVRALYVISSAVVLLIVFAALLRARTTTGIALVAALASLTLLLMINPSKGSYSMPPTMPICIVLALLTVIMTEAKQPKVQLAATAALGIVLGLSVNIRIANALLAFGYLLVLAINFVRMRGRLQLLQGFLFGATFVAGILPTLVANAINAGSPFSTPYSAIDLVHDFSWASVSARIVAYGSGSRGAVLWAAILSTAIFWLYASRLRLKHARLIALLVSANLATNLAYYLTHVAYASYYAIPLAILSMWTLCFAFLASEKNSHPTQAAQAAPSMLRRALAVALAGATAAYVAFAMFRMSPEVAPPRPPSIEDRSVVVWAHLHAGMVAHNFERYAAKGITGVTPDIQDRVIGAIARDRRTQVFINDTDEMQRLIDRSAKFGTMRPAGRMFGYDVYSLLPRD